MLNFRHQGNGIKYSVLLINDFKILLIIFRNNTYSEMKRKLKPFKNIYLKGLNINSKVKYLMFT